MSSGQNNPVIFFGTGPVAAASLDFIADHFDVEAVITKRRSPRHKGSVPVEELCAKRALPTFFVDNKQQLDDLIANQSFSSNIGIVVDFGIIISQSVIDTFERGIVNSHFSMLPEWRGADPISFTVLSGQEKTGVSLMVIDARLDTGKLITQRKLSVDPKDTTGSLTDKLVDFSNRLILEYLPRYIQDDIVPTNQPHPDRATYSRKLTKQDAQINWQESATDIERKIRAFQPWPKARGHLGKIECIITEADVVPGLDKPAGTISFDLSNNLIIACGTDSLSIKRLQPLGKKEMPVQAFLAGYRSQLD